MSLSETKLPKAYTPSTQRSLDIQREGDGELTYWLKPTVQKSSIDMFSPSANLAMVGFPTSLQPFDIPYLPRESSDAKIRQLLTHHGGDHGLKSSHSVAMVTHDRCGRSVGPVLPHPRPRSETSANELRTNDKHTERGVVADTYASKAAMRMRRGPLMLTSELERRLLIDNSVRDGRLEDIGLEKMTEKVNGREASSPSKKLKFGIDSILAIGSKTSEKTDRNNNTDGHHAAPSQPTAHWNCDVVHHRADVKRGSEINEYKTPAHPVSKPALRRPISGLSSPPVSCALWGGGATQLLLADGRWDGAPSRLVEVGPTGWGLRNKSRECQDLVTHHNPFQLVRNTELGNAHPPHVLRTALPPAHHHHPTLPRSYHHVHPVVHVPSSRPPHFQNGGGDSGVKAHSLGVNGGILDCGSGGIGALGSGGHKRKRSWSRAVFTSLQRKGLEKRFEIQKYVNKPERRQLASALGLSDAQVKVWFQNRRMKWRHSQQFKRSPHQEQQHPTQQQDHEAEQPEENAFNSDSDESSIRLSSTTPDIKLGNGDATFEIGAIFIANADDSSADNNGSGDDDVDNSQK